MIFPVTISLLLLALVSADDCPRGWTRMSTFSRCIMVNTFLTSFDGATDFCKVYGATLIGIHNAFENAEILAIAKNATSNPTMWIGLSNEYADGNYYWQDGTNLTFTNFEPGYPVEKAKSCVTMNAAGRWTNRFDCNQQSAAGYICVLSSGGEASPVTFSALPSTVTLQPATVSSEPITTILSPVVTTAEPIEISTVEYTESPVEGWTYYNGNWYKATWEVNDWGAAEINCEQLGGHLASIHNDQENEFVVGLVNAIFWPGIFSNSYINYNFTWTDGSPVDYLNFANGYPKHSYNCIAVFSDGYWGDHPCNDRIPGVCEKYL